MSQLRIYFSSLWRDSTSPCPWALCDETGAVLQSGIDPLAALPKSRECIAIAAPDRVLCVAAKLPPGSRRRWQAALPYIAEEHTLPDPEENHVVPEPVHTDGRMMLSIVDKQWLRRIVEACLTAKLNLRRLIPETFLPALTLGSWTLVWDGHSGFMRSGTASGIALDHGDREHAPLALRLSLNSMPAAEKIEVRFPQHVPEPQRILPQWDGLTLFAGPAWDWQRAAIPPDALNLLWGDFAPRARISEYWPKLRPAALILLAALGVETLGANLEWAMLAQEKKTLTQDMAHSFRAAFGEASALVNAPLQMARKLAELRHGAGLPDDGDFLPLLDAAAPVLATLPQGSIRGLHYETGRLDVDLRLNKSQDFKDLQKRLPGLSVQIGDLHETGNGAEARLTLLAGGLR